MKESVRGVPIFTKNPVICRPRTRQPRGGAQRVRPNYRSGWRGKED